MLKDFIDNIIDTVSKQDPIVAAKFLLTLLYFLDRFLFRYGQMLMETTYLSDAQEIGEREKMKKEVEKLKSMLYSELVGVLDGVDKLFGGDV